MNFQIKPQMLIFLMRMKALSALDSVTLFKKQILFVPFFAVIARLPASIDSPHPALFVLPKSPVILPQRILSPERRTARKSTPTGKTIEKSSF